MPVKADLRKKLKSQLALLSPEEIRDRSARACELLQSEPEYINSEIIMIFLSLPSEINTSRLVLQAWQDRKRVLAPQVGWEQRRMIPIEIRSLTDEQLEETPWNIRQPTYGTPVPVSMIDLVIVPGLGFDPQGHRLGRGRGFYDRFLAQREFRGKTCAMAFEEQVVEEIPADAHDMRIDMLVTDQRVRHFNPSARSVK